MSFPTVHNQGDGEVFIDQNYNELYEIQMVRWWKRFFPLSLCPYIDCFRVVIDGQDIEDPYEDSRSRRDATARALAF